MTGKLITFEGGEGAGKTTQVAWLQNFLEEKGKKVTIAREPGGTHVSEQIRQVLLDPKNQDIEDLTEVLLYQAARAQVYHELVRPALARGEIVLMDRSQDSSLVYQGVVRGMGVDLIAQLNQIATGNLQPDLTFLLDVPVAIGLQRKQEDEITRLELEGEAFHEKVRQGYLSLAQRPEFERIKIIDATKNEATVQAEIATFLAEII